MVAAFGRCSQSFSNLYQNVKNRLLPRSHPELHHPTPHFTLFVFVGAILCKCSRVFGIGLPHPCNPFPYNPNSQKQTCTLEYSTYTHKHTQGADASCCREYLYVSKYVPGCTVYLCVCVCASCVCYNHFITVQFLKMFHQLQRFCLESSNIGYY